MSDNLTPYRCKLAYLARAALKEGRATQTWVFDGKIFVKVEKNDKPVVIRYRWDIPLMKINDKITKMLHSLDIGRE